MGVSCFMDFKRIIYAFRGLAVIVSILIALSSLHAHPASAELTKMFPPDLGSFHLEPLSIRPLVTFAGQVNLQSDYFASKAGQDQPSLVLGGEAEYSSADGDKLLIEILKLQSDDEAYSLLTLAVRKMDDAIQSRGLRFGDVGTADVTTAESVTFFKGQIFARVTKESNNSSDQAVSLARLLAATFDKGAGDIPVLVKHLPDWESAQRNAIYAVNIGAIREAISNQPILNEISFEGGTEAVTATYGQSQLVIIEFTTPQFAGDNDRRIVTKIQELQDQRQPAPTAYRRVGNYSVFVFNAPDEKIANQLIDRVKYEHVVQWLGDDPHLFERLERYYAETTAGALVAVLESSGLSLLVCLGIGGLIGTLLFRHRRAQRATRYSDAGGSVRLNLDELTTKRDSGRLLGRGDPGGSNPDQS